MQKRSTTTKNISLLAQLHQDGQLTLTSEFQRDAVWPTPAKAYLIDTIINDKPIPFLFFQRSTSPQTGRTVYTVVDGQQRLRAVFEFLEDRFRLSQSNKKESHYNKRFSNLPNQVKEAIRNYDLVIEELSGYSDGDIRDMFVRMNKYVVALSRQELRHAKEEGKFKDFVEGLGKLDFWLQQRVFSLKQVRRMRPVEFAAELTILLIEGPQDKKKAIDLYYGRYSAKFGFGGEIKDRLSNYMSWIQRALPSFPKTRYRSPVDFYSLIGALEMVTKRGTSLKKLNPVAAGKALEAFETKTRAEPPKGNAARYVAAASRQTDNVIPRNTRIEILADVLSG
jgi:hypothetical protein